MLNTFKRLIFIILILSVNLLYSQEAQEPPVNIPIIKAVANNDINTLKKLIEDGADVNVKDTEGNTPLIWASLLGLDKMVKELISSGADIDIGNKFGNLFGNKSEIIGGIVLMGIGIKILVEHLFF